MKREDLEKIEKANNILTDVYFEITEQRGCAQEAKRLDTILEKLFKLICEAEKKAR